MRSVLSILLFFLLTIITFGQEVKYYNFSVKFDIPKKIIEVEGDVHVELQNQDSIDLILWKNTKIESITVDENNADYTFDTVGKSPNFFIPDGGKLTIKNIKSTKGEIPLHFVYACNMENVSGWARSFTEDWIELGFHTAWYPVHSVSKKFTSHISVYIDNSFTLSGSGIVKKDGDHWDITHSWPVFDNVIIASKNLKTKEFVKENIALDLVYTNFPEKDLDSVSIECEKIYKFYSSLFGAPDGSYLKFVINPLQGVGGYGRSKYFSLKASEFNLYLIKGIAHEMSHFWWQKAETTTWEDWLNEAFAEYSMLLYLRKKDKEEFNKNIEQSKKWTINSPPIWGVDRNAPEAYDAIYNKGSLILLEFEDKIGTQKFNNFSKTLLNKKITNTIDFLNLVETELSKENRDWFEKKLKA